MCGSAGFSGGKPEPLSRGEKIALVAFAIAVLSGAAWHYWPALRQLL